MKFEGLKILPPRTEMGAIGITEKTFEQIGYSAPTAGDDWFSRSDRLSIPALLGRSLNPDFTRETPEGASGIKARLLLWSGYYRPQDLHRLRLLLLELSRSHAGEALLEKIEELDDYLEELSVGAFEPGVNSPLLLLDQDNLRTLSPAGIKLYRAFIRSTLANDLASFDQLFAAIAENSPAPQATWRAIFILLDSFLLSVDELRSVGRMLRHDAKLLVDLPNYSEIEWRESGAIKRIQVERDLHEDGMEKMKLLANGGGIGFNMFIE